MRLFSILLAGMFLVVAGCGGGDDTEPAIPGVGASGGDIAPVGMDPKAMEVDPLKDDDGKVIDPGGKDEAPPGESIIPKEVSGALKGGGDKKGGDKKGGDKKGGDKKGGDKKGGDKKGGDKKGGDKKGGDKKGGDKKGGDKKN